MDGPALLAAAVRAACLAKAPRRTVQAVAAAVAGVLVRQMAEAVPRPRSEVPAGAQVAAEPTEDLAGLVGTLRTARRSRRARKRRSRAKSAAAAVAAEAKAGVDGVAVPVLVDAVLAGKAVAAVAALSEMEMEMEVEEHVVVPVASAGACEVPRAAVGRGPPTALGGSKALLRGKSLGLKTKAGKKF